ncbi:MAG: twin-arginine translocation signal domain-containing protein, partial [Piscinibacter sp.]|uniref:twin-arginine translocation signal domain-containing protein n=1 Tax=Piscinibacter sp. TaxID=1903157 RepID=UPI003D0A867F
MRTRRMAFARRLVTMTTRRELLARSASVAAALAGLGLLPQAAQAAWSQAAFDAKNMGDLMKAL